MAVDMFGMKITNCILYIFDVKTGVGRLVVYS
jgi:hypothetical protein